jgi:hypothetical protein
MNPWDVVTWLSAIALAASAVGIFGFFLRDARSILDREMHGHDDDGEESSASGTAPESTSPAPPEDFPR